jgi:DMSO/TMAO reductase YedYZ molybdopterin-dependent catalytic subunit
MSKERYIAAKQKWAEKQVARGVRPLTERAEGRLPPGQKLTDGFPVLDLGVQPDLSLADWTLTIDGLVEHPTVLSWADFNALPQVSDVSDFHCVTTWSKYDCRWDGVPFTALYERVPPTAEVFDQRTAGAVPG